MPTIEDRFLLRGGLKSALVSLNEVPLRRELIVELDNLWTTGELDAKIGDGTTHYVDLPYLTAAGVTVRPVAIQAALSDETTSITTGIAKITFRTPYAFTLTEVRASLSTASSSGLPTFDIKQGGTSVLSTLVTIDATEKTSTTAATPSAISTPSIADDAEITVDITAAGTGAKGAKVTLIGTVP